MQISKENRLDPLAFELVKVDLSEEELEVLRDFADNKNTTANLTNKSSKEVIMNRLDELDSDGIIARLTNLFREHVVGKYYINGHVEVRSYVALRTEQSQGYGEDYSPLDEGDEVSYTAVIPLSRLGEDYVGGALSYKSGGDGFSITPGTISVHRNEPGNSWRIANVLGGTRLDLLLVQAERRISVTYEGFSIDPYVDDGSEF